MTQPLATVLGNLATLAFNLTSSGSFTVVNNVKSISVPEPEWAIANMSGLQDTVDVKVCGFQDTKQFSFEIYHTVANKTLIDTTWASFGPINWQITLSDNTGWTFAAIMSGWKGKLERNTGLYYEVTCQITGDYTPIEE